MNSAARQPKPDSYVLRARYVFPVAGPPIAGGCVTVAGERIVEVGRTSSAANVRDLGNVAILPGLVNAHTHLEFSDFAAPLGSPGMGFAHWISQVTASRGRSTHVAAENNNPPLPSGEGRGESAPKQSPVARGLQESLATGTTSIGEIAVAGWSAEPFDQAPIDAIIFRELICLSPERIPAALAIAKEHLEARPTAKQKAGLSPHAPYTVHPELFARAIDLAVEHSAPVAFHLAESRDELELLRSGSGPFYDYLSSRGFWVPGAIPLGTRPMDYLRHLARGPRSLVVHGNLLDDEEQAFVAQHRDRLSVIYCPRTHAFFGHPRHSLKQLLALGAHVALGTDSRASNPDLSLLEEMRFVARAYPELSGGDVLRLGTLNGAEALGIEQSAGSLTAGKYANLAVIPLPEHEPGDPHELLFGSSLPCRTTVCRGEIVGIGKAALDEAGGFDPGLL